MKIIKFKNSKLLYLSSVLFFTQIINAQDTIPISKQNVLDEVTVYGEKRENKVQKTATPITVIDEKKIKNSVIQSLNDISGFAPNLYVSNAGSPTLNFISLRGIFQFSATSSLVGVSLDDVPILNAYSMSSQIENIERIEILRGPQSTLYGGNAFGGIIAITTKKPTNVFHTFGEVGVGNYNLLRTKAGASGAIIKDKLFAGASLYHNGLAGIYYNTTLNGNYDKTQNTGGNIFLKYVGNNGFSLRLNSRIEYNNLKGIFPYVNTKEEAFDTPYTNSANGKNVEKRTLFTNSLLAKYETDKHIFSSVSGYTFLNDKYDDYDVDFTKYDWFKFTQNDPINTFTQEFKIATKNQDKLRYVMGLYGFLDDHYNTETRTFVGSDAVALGSNYASAPFSTGNQSTRKEYGLAVYTNINYALTDKLDVIAGLRLDYSWREMVLKGDFIKEPYPPMMNPEKNFSGKDVAISPRLGFAYKLKDDFLLFANYSRGFNPGGLNQYTTNPNYTSYKPQYLNTFEIGQKSQWLGNKFRTNTTFFYSIWNDQQQTGFLPPDYLEQAITNNGKLNLYGAEAEISALIFKGFQVDYNLGFTQTEFKSLLLLDPSNPTTVLDYKGNKQVFTPNITSTLSFSYQHTIFKNTDIRFTPEWKYYGQQYMNYYNTVEQAPFHILNANLAVKHGCWELSFWIKNATKSKYLAFFNASSASNGYSLLGAPQTFGTTLRVDL
ncbi:TonB-dependent receptor [Flavobacterium marginilacus]|uniref:TonB-dependent receptor n=1 Tax=Flavobacterium marginilacus TaxID=3003256 RepID=UPI00248DC22A|nr:TonB-dependent receptor [Flavobacterium marginilacus]